MAKEKIKKFWNEHKKEVVAGATVVIGGVLLGVACKKWSAEAKRLGSLKNNGVDVFDNSDDTFITIRLHSLRCDYPGRYYRLCR